MKKNDIKVGGTYATGSSRSYGQDTRQQALVLATGYSANDGEPFEGKYSQRDDAVLVIVAEHRPYQKGPEPVDLDTARKLMTEKLYLDRKQAIKNLNRWSGFEAWSKALAPFPKDLPGWHLKVLPNRYILQDWEEYVEERAKRFAFREEQQIAKVKRDKENAEEAALIRAELETFGVPGRISAGARTVLFSFEQYHQLVDRTGRD